LSGKIEVYKLKKSIDNIPEILYEPEVKPTTDNQQLTTDNQYGQYCTGDGGDLSGSH
jgi:hypothetical protein